MQVGFLSKQAFIGVLPDPKMMCARDSAAGCIRHAWFRRIVRSLRGIQSAVVGG